MTRVVVEVAVRSDSPGAGDERQTRDDVARLDAGRMVDLRGLGLVGSPEQDSGSGGMTMPWYASDAEVAVVFGSH